MTEWNMTDEIDVVEAPAAAQRPAPREPGLHFDVPEDDYHGGPEVSVSRLKRLAEAPAKVLVPQKETAALTAGTLRHLAILQPHLLEQRYFVTDLDRISAREKATQAEMERAGGRELVKRGEWEAALRLRDAVHTHPTLRDMLAPEGLACEASFYWVDPVTKLRCRGRADALRTDWQVAIDIKTTEDASPVGFAKSVANYRYHWQEAFYRRGLGLTWMNPQAFFFVAVEKEPPYLPAIYELDRRAVDLGERDITAQLEIWARCERSGIWPGYDERPVRLDLPAWVYAQAGEYA
jgi:hypothetical protein